MQMRNKERVWLGGGLSAGWQINSLHLDTEEGPWSGWCLCLSQVDGYQPCSGKTSCADSGEELGYFLFQGDEHVKGLPRDIYGSSSQLRLQKNAQNLEPISAGRSLASLSAALPLSLCSRGDDVRFYHVPMIFPIRGSEVVVMTKGLFNWSWGRLTSKGGNFWTTFFLFWRAENPGAIFVLGGWDKHSTLDVTHSHSELLLSLSLSPSWAQRDPSVVWISEFVHHPPNFTHLQLTTSSGCQWSSSSKTRARKYKIVWFDSTHFG